MDLADRASTLRRRPGDTGDADAVVGVDALPGGDGELFGDRGMNRPALGQQVVVHSGDVTLRVDPVGDQPAPVGDAGGRGFGEQHADQPSGKRLGGGHGGAEFHQPAVRTVGAPAGLLQRIDARGIIHPAVNLTCPSASDRATLSSLLIPRWPRRNRRRAGSTAGTINRWDVMGRWSW